MADRVVGSVKFFMADRAYGFLTPDAGGDDVFVHLKDLKPSGIRELVKDQRVSFEVIPGRDGKPKAIAIQLVK